MAHIIQQKTAFSSIPNPPYNAKAIGFDTDGIFKSKDYYGNVVPIGSAQSVILDTGQIAFGSPYGVT